MASSSCSRLKLPDVKLDEQSLGKSVCQTQYTDNGVQFGRISGIFETQFYIRNNKQTTMDRKV